MGATFIDGYLDRSKSLEVFSGETYMSYTNGVKEYSIDVTDKLVCFDARKLYATGLSHEKMIYDLKLLYECDGELSRLVRSIDIQSRGDYLELEKRFSAHTKAISAAKVDVEKIPLKELIPDDLRISYMNARLLVMQQLWEKLSPETIVKYESTVFPVFKDILQMESSGIKIDEVYVDAQLKRNDLASHETKFFQHIKGNIKNGFVKTRICPVGSKTWRLRVESGFNCMAIPHGVARRAIVSRFEGGKIATLDFNAVDYRCLVKAVNSAELNVVYDGQRDFHAATANVFGVVTPELREQVKKITYAHIYGSSIDTLQKLTRLPQARLNEMIKVLDERFAPITKFRRELSDKARKEGFVVTPAGHKIDIDKRDHDGKIIGLFAQTFSSSILNASLKIALQLLLFYKLDKDSKSKIIFTVHDEIVVDVHPEEEGIVGLMKKFIEASTGFVVKQKEGKSYGEATDG